MILLTLTIPLLLTSSQYGNSILTVCFTFSILVLLFHHLQIISHELPLFKMRMLAILPLFSPLTLFLRLKSLLYFHAINNTKCLHSIHNIDSLSCFHSRLILKVEDQFLHLLKWLCKYCSFHTQIERYIIITFSILSIFLKYSLFSILCLYNNPMFFQSLHPAICADRPTCCPPFCHSLN